MGESVGAGDRRAIADDVATRAARLYWDGEASSYQDHYGPVLRDVGFIWCPEQVDEAEVGLLGEVAGRRVLEVGCGAAQCSRWLAARGADPVAFDISSEQLRHAHAIDESTGFHVPVVQADAQRIPFADASFDLAFTAFGAIGFVPDSAAIMREVSRVLRAGGRWVFAWSHPMRWCLYEADAPEGLRVAYPYFDRTPYVEVDERSEPVYVEHHATFGDRVRELVAAGFTILDVIEPEFPEHEIVEWGPLWTRALGEYVPGTAIWVTEKRA